MRLFRTRAQDRIEVNGVIVEVKTEKVFNGEGEFVVVQIINTLGKKLLVKAPKEEFRLPPGVYC